MTEQVPGLAIDLGEGVRNGATERPAGRFGWSSEARALFRPFATYRQLGAAESSEASWWLAIRRPLFYLALLGGFVSMSASGRLVVPHVLGTIAFWAFLPIFQMAAVLAVWRTLARQRRWAWCIDLLFVGQAPWLLLLLGMVGICLFAPSVYATFSALLRTGVLPVLLVLTFAWSALLTLACYRGGLGMSRRRGGLALAMHYTCYSGTILAWFWFTNQLAPLLAAAP